MWDKIVQFIGDERRLALITLLLLPLYAHVFLQLDRPSLSKDFNGITVLLIENGRARAAVIKDLDPKEITYLYRYNRRLSLVREVLGSLDMKTVLILDNRSGLPVSLQSDGVWFSRTDLSRTRDLLVGTIESWLSRQTRLEHSSRLFAAQIFYNFVYNAGSAEPKPWRLILRGWDVRKLNDERLRWMADDILPHDMSPLRRYRLAHAFKNYLVRLDRDTIDPLNIWQGFLGTLKIDIARDLSQYYTKVFGAPDWRETPAKVRNPISVQLSEKGFSGWKDLNSGIELPDSLGMIDDRPAIDIRELVVTTCALPTVERLVGAVLSSQVLPQQLVLNQDCGRPTSAYTIRINWPIFQWATTHGRLTKSFRVHQLPDWVLLADSIRI